MTSETRLPLTFDRFREISCVLLGGLVGVLIGLPWWLSSQSIFLPLGAGLAGLFLGYRKRKSVFFFYLCLFSVVALSSLLSSGFLEKP